LTAEQVRRIYEAADTIEQRLITIALAGWGLRPGEVAALHASQISLDTDDPHLEFDEDRKNGPGTVALLVGLEALADRLDELAEADDWNGYVFPSDRAAAGHIHVDTVRRRFKRLAREGGVTVAGDTPKAKMGRRFWYNSYQEAVSELLDQLDEIAAEQGSDSAEVVMANYLSEERRRNHRRDAMRDTLKSVFDDDTEFS
jgi:integrase